MNRTAVFPGSFDPFTSGHEAIVRRAAKLFDTIVVAVGVNSDKQYMFSSDERLLRIRQMLSDLPQVQAVAFSDMTIDLCHRVGAKYILRGIRNAQDLEYEQTIAAVNHTLDPDIETILLVSDVAHRDISSTLEREKLLHSRQQ